MLKKILLFFCLRLYLTKYRFSIANIRFRRQAYALLFTTKLPALRMCQLVFYQNRKSRSA